MLFRSMKMATGDGFPLRQGAGTGSREVFGGTEAGSGGTPNLYSVLEVLRHVGIYGCRGYVGGATGAPRGRGCAPHPRGQPVSPLTCTPSSLGCFPSKNNFFGRFHFVSTLFNIPFLRNTETREKQELALGSGLIG